MAWVPKTKNDRGKMVGVSGPAFEERTLACGHDTYSAPIVTGRRKLFRCPEGCGLQPVARPVRRAA